MDQPFNYNNDTPDFEETPQDADFGVVYREENAKKHFEKKGIKKNANIIGLACLIMLVIPFVMRLALSFFVQILYRFDCDVSFILGPAFLKIYSIISATTILLVPFLLVFKAANYRISDLMSFAKPKKGYSLPLFFIGVGFCSFANVAVASIGTFFSQFGIKYELNEGENPQGIYGIMLTMIATCVVPALIEEFACRGILMGALKKYGNGFAVFASAVLFGIMHGNFRQIPFAFLVGLVLGFVTIKSGSLWPAIFIHAFNNGTSVLFDYFVNPKSQQINQIAYPIFLISTLLMGLLGVLMLAKKEDAFVLEKCDMVTGVGKRYFWFFSSPFVLAYICLSVINAFEYFK